MSTRFSSGLSVCILNLDRPDLIVPLCRALQAQAKNFLHAGVGFEVLIGDTGSTHVEVLALWKELESSKNFRVFQGLKYHFSKNNNFLALTKARYATVLFLNNDVILPAQDPEILFRIYNECSREKTLVGARLFYQDGRVQHSGIRFVERGSLRALPFDPFTRERPEVIPSLETVQPAATGAFLFASRDLLEALRGFDETYAAECQDVDLCLKAHRLGLPTRVLESSAPREKRIVHLENATRPKGEINPLDRSRFLKKWKSYIEAHFVGREP